MRSIFDWYLSQYRDKDKMQRNMQWTMILNGAVLFFAGVACVFIAAFADIANSPTREERIATGIISFLLCSGSGSLMFWLGYLWRKRDPK